MNHFIWALSISKIIERQGVMNYVSYWYEGLSNGI